MLKKAHVDYSLVLSLRIVFRLILNTSGALRTNLHIRLLFHGSRISTSQVDKEEVRLRRTIGLKKDEYFLDGKHIT